MLIERLRDEVRALDRDLAAGETLVALLEDQRERRRDRLLDALGSERYFTLLDTFDSAVASLAEVASEQEAQEIAAGEFEELRRAAKQLAPDPADEELHALRITAKHARYGAELMAAGGVSKPLQRYLDALKNLQDVIGEHQDAVVAEARLRKLARSRTAVAAGRLIEGERARRAEQRRRYPAALAEVLARGSKAVG